MILPACLLLLLAASTRVELLDETFEIPRAEWKYVPVNLRQRPATVAADFEVQSGSKQVRVALLTSDDMERLRAEAPHGVLAATRAAGRGALNFRVRHPGDYVIVIDNREGTDQSTVVKLRVSLDFAEAPAPAPIELSRGRQVTVIAASFLFFFGVVTYSARRILRAIQK